MPDRNDAALDFFRTRRSRPAKTLRPPVPGRDEVTDLLTCAARVPDHGKLEPWRFVVLGRPALARLAAGIAPRGRALGIDPDRIAKAEAQFRDADLAIAVISSPKPSEKVPESEQVLSAGAVCLGLLNAALASGWGANWLSGWPSHDRAWREDELGLAPHETVAGFIHIGTETSPPPERPRPDVGALTTWDGA